VQAQLAASCAMPELCGHYHGVQMQGTWCLLFGTEFSRSPAKSPGDLPVTGSGLVSGVVATDLLFCARAVLVPVPYKLGAADKCHKVGMRGSSTVPIGTDKSGTDIARMRVTQTGREYISVARADLF
jgi:hypothetical protein